MTAHADVLTAIDRLDIAEAVGGIMLHLDMRQWGTVASYLLPEVTTDYTSVHGRGVVQCTREELVEGWSLRLPGFDATQHTVTQISITATGADSAATVSNLRAAHWVDGRCWAFVGSYHHTLRKVEEGWRIASIRIAMTQEEGDRGVWEAAVVRMAERAGMTVDEVNAIGRRDA